MDYRLNIYIVFGEIQHIHKMELHGFLYRFGVLFNDVIEDFSMLINSFDNFIAVAHFECGVTLYDVGDDDEHQ